MNKHVKIRDFGPNVALPVQDPLTYCLVDTVEVPFTHGGNSYIYGPKSQMCQQYSAEYCAQNWSPACEFMAQNTNSVTPNLVFPSGGVNNTLTLGEILVRNTASVKYLKEMNGACHLKTEYFDPTVTGTPTISSWVADNIGSCKPVFTVKDTVNIDSDPVMNKLLDSPYIGFDILMNIKDTMQRDGTISKLANSRLGHFFAYIDRRRNELCQRANAIASGPKLKPKTRRTQHPY